MDLMAYAQLETLSKIAKDNGIEVPRLRGYRLMKDEHPISQEEINKIIKEREIYTCKSLCQSIPTWNPNADFILSSRKTDLVCNYYLVKDIDIDEDGLERYVGIRWDRIHGWKRKILKYEIKKRKKTVQEQFNMWNKYAGRENVLYIHSRIGGGNWSYFGGDELTKMSWFLDKVDDCFDYTYCDIYASIK